MGNQWVWGLHFSFLSIFLVATKHTCLGAQNSTRSCHERERLALLEFKDSVKDDFKVLSSWVGIDCCSWKGVRCDDATGRVAALHLRGDYHIDVNYNTHDYYAENYYLEGNNVKVYFGELRHLKHLDLSGNNFQGSQFPKFIGSFKQLSYLNLSNTYFSGTIPQHIGNLSLKVIDLSYNSLNSSIPVMPNLLKLDVSSNKFEHIKLVGIWRQRHLKELSVSGNHFGGEMIGPSSNMSECSHYALEVLEADESELKGSIPESVGKLNNLRVLSVSYNSFTGSIPKSVGKLNNLRVLSLYSNSFTGSIPKALERLRSLEVLDLSSNKLTGPIPTFLGNLTKLDLSNNQLSGSIPESLGRLTGLIHLGLQSNLLTGTIPDSLWQLTKLISLDISNNSLEGVVLEAHSGGLRIFFLGVQKFFKDFRPLAI